MQYVPRIPNEPQKSDEFHIYFIVFESQEFLRAWENNNFMAKNCSLHVHEINAKRFVYFCY